MNPFYLIVLGLFFLIIALDQLIRRRAYAKSATLFEKGHYEELLAYLDTWYPRMLFPVYNRSVMKFNVYQCLDRIEEAATTLEGLLAMDCSDDQRAFVLLNGFQFYLKHEMKEQAEAVLTTMESNEKFADEAPGLRRVYEIALNDSTAYIDQMEGELSSADQQTQITLHLLLAHQYRTLGNTDKAEEHLKHLS